MKWSNLLLNQRSASLFLQRYLSGCVSNTLVPLHTHLGGEGSCGIKVSYPGTQHNGPVSNRPRSIYQYSSMAPRLPGQNCKFFKFPLSLNSQKRLRYKKSNTKYRGLTWKPRSHVRILIYRTWPIRYDRWIKALTTHLHRVSLDLK